LVRMDQEQQQCNLERDAGRKLTANVSLEVLVPHGHVVEGPSPTAQLHSALVAFSLTTVMLFTLLQ